MERHTIVLIETYWNVKFTISNGVVATSIDVLIETYWNVKFIQTPISCSAAEGINRNILECKEC